MKYKALARLCFPLVSPRGVMGTSPEPSLITDVLRRKIPAGLSTNPFKPISCIRHARMNKQHTYLV